MTPQETTLRDQMIANAKAYNTSLTTGYLNRHDSETILNFTHPAERGDFRLQLEKIRKEAQNDQ